MLFKQVIGQENIKQRLIQSAREKRVSHTQMWLGNAGFGSLPLALAFIQYLFCENPSETDSCGVCSSCQKVSKLQHPDLHFSFPTVIADAKIADVNYPEWRKHILENPYFNLNQWIEFIDPKGRKPIIGTEESQNILKKLRLKSFEGGFKILLIWMAEEMNDTCSNKLLKILEEPPENTLFFLLCDRMDDMLPTIVSRTQLLRIPKLDTTSMTQQLKDQFNLSASQAEELAHFSAGDWITASELARTGSINQNLRNHFIEGFRAAYKKDVLGMIAWANNLAGLAKEEQKSFLLYGLHLFRQSILFNYTQDRLVRLGEEERNFLQNFAKFITGNNLEDLTQLFSESHYHINRNASPKILFTDLIFQVMRHIHRA
jgi:DNA polymerase-3 subunit delta'